MKYEGQVSDLTVPFPGDQVNRQTVDDVIAAFDQEHDRSFGYNSPGTGYRLVNVRVIARGLPETPRMPERLELPAPTNSSVKTQRDVYFGPNRGWASVPVIDRGSLAGATSEGPLIVEEYDSTTVVPPGWNATTDQWSNIILQKAK
jgi:N-methylhydantoinase A